MQLTSQQEKAIKERDNDILVSAGAGAGKTRVLVSRIADMITDPGRPVSLDEILVMTFTNAAAREMKERIGRELSERLQGDPGNQFLRRQIRLIPQADISTVHSFCSRLLRNHFQEAGLDPSFRIGEEGEMMLLKHQAMEELLESCYSEQDPDFLKVVEAFAPGKDDRILEEMTERIYQFSRGFPDAESWFRDQIQKAETLSDPEAFDDSEPVIRLLYKTGRLIRELVSGFDSFMSLCHERGEVLPERYASILREDERALASLSRISSYRDYCRFLKDVSFSRLPGGVRKDEKDFSLSEEAKELHKRIREEICALRDTHFCLTPEELCRENKEILPCLRGVISMLAGCEEIYGRLKREQNVYDFDDLEHQTLKLLVKEYDENGLPVPSETARGLARKYKEIFVDEYQDTSLIQETILNAIHFNEADNHLFVVGDVKQSIYRFRQARPDLFLARLKRYEEGSSLTVDLTDNFRSAPDVLAFDNYVFSALMDRDFGGIDYDRGHALRAGVGGPMENSAEKSEILLLMEDEEKDHIRWEYDALYAESAMIAGRIRELIGEGYHYGDMVILLRSGSWRAEFMTEYLRKLSIPAVCESRTGYFNSLEVGVILNYLSVIDNVYQDIPMASVLLSSIGGFSEEELALLKTQIEIPMREEYSLYELIELYADTGEDEILKQRYKAFLDRLSGFRKQKKEMPLHRLIWNIYQETGYYYDVLLMSEGAKRRENLNMLLKKAEDYEKTVFKGLFYFIRYMDQLKSYEVELAEAGAGSADTDMVRVMTIHKSKGLEFPVVFVSCLSGRFNFKDDSQSFLYHPEMGIGCDVVDAERRIRHPSMMKNMLKDQIHKETLQEELRILYVAMTRARNRLVMTGVVTDKMVEKHQKNQLRYEDKLSAGSYMDWVLPLVLAEDMKERVRKVHLHQLDEILSSGKEESSALPPEELLFSSALPEDLSPVEKAFSYEYPFRRLTTIKRKYSVSELKKLSMAAPSENQDNGETEYETFPADEDVPVPAFLEKKNDLAPAARGTIVHKIMELLPFGRINSSRGLYEALEEIREDYPQTDQVSMKSIYAGAEAFLFSQEGEILRQMDAAGRLYKEVPFTICIPASLAGEGYPEDENVIVQGVIDAYGDEEGGLWLIDYKTDHVREGQEQLLLDRYSRQMLYYKTALEMLVKKPVIRSYIYSFALRSFIKVF